MLRSPAKPALAERLRAWDLLRRPVWLFDPVTCRGLYANAAAVALWDAATIEELLARDFSELSPAVRTRTERLAQATAGGEAVTERWSFYPGGRPVTVQAVISAFALEDGRSVLLFEAAPADATPEELRAVEALRHTSTLISLFDAGGRSRFANPAAFAAYGEAGRDFASRFGDPARGAEALAATLSGEMLAELRQVRTETGERWHHLDARRVTDPATGELAALVSERDVTAQVEAERALAAATERVEVAEAKQRFLANISHELRTPLNAVTGFAGLMAAGELNEGQRGHLAHIAEAGERLAEILNNVIDISELDRGELGLETAAFDLAAFTESLLLQARPAAEAKGLTLSLEAPAELPAVEGDAERLGKALCRYLSNAVKFTERGGVTLRVETKEAGESADVTFSVIDTGPGLDAAAQGRLFRRFSQADESVRKRVAGGGLGLAIAKELAALMGGEVGCETAPGEGARFWLAVRLPYAQATVVVEDAPPPDARPIRVLYADDHASNRILVQAVLQSQGIACELACDGAEAVAAVRGGDFDLVLMDIQMPVMDGVAAVREIRALPGPAGRMPILALTANTLSEQRQEYAEAGMQDCLAKPVVIPELIAKTLHWVAVGRADAPQAAPLAHRASPQ